MERLQGSPRVVDLYDSYCGTSVAIEFVSDRKLRDVTKRMPSRQTLSLATHSAGCIADVHSIGGDRPSLAQNDIRKDSILYTPDERPLLHDFNLGMLVMLRPETNITYNLKAKGDPPFPGEVSIPQ
jgi:hypothetical protein